jgi:hypothetical protein
MSITTSAFRFALTAAALCAAASTADAKPKRVVILDFDGPRQLADVGRSSVMSVLGEQYDVVSTKRWEQARAAAAQKSHGPEQWSRAAKQSGVGAVIEGCVQDEGRRKILNVVVRQADNGKEFDTISVRLDGKNGISAESSRQLQASLDEILDWIDSGQNETQPVYPPVTAKRIGSSKPANDDEADVDARVRRRGRSAAPAASIVIDDDTAAVDAPPARQPRKPKRPAAEIEDGDAPPARATRSETRSEARPEARTDEPADTTAGDEPTHAAKPQTVATADPEIHDIEVLFPPGAPEGGILDPKIHHVPWKTPRFMIDGGGYMGSRTLTWDAPPDANVTPFAGVSTKGFQVNAAVYPFPTKEIDGVLSGVGFTASLHHSAGSTVVFDNTDTVEEYVLNQNGWELGVHYRAPLSSLVTIDGGAFYGNQTFEIIDASQDFEVPDTKYSYLGASAHLDLAITDHALVGFGARYFTVLDAGDLASIDWFGPVSASGLGLEATFQIPLPANLYVRGQLAYQRISLETTGGGQITDDEGVTGGTDSLITGNVNLGIAF